MKSSETAWPVRYWHPTEGHVLDPNHSVRFCRREDAEAMLRRDHLFGGARPVEHTWLAPHGTTQHSMVPADPPETLHGPDASSCDGGK